MSRSQTAALASGLARGSSGSRRSFDEASCLVETACAGILHRSAFGPREAVSTKQLASSKLRREPLDPTANPFAKAAVWLRDNL